MAEQVIELVPGESKLVSFEAVPSVARTYQVSVDGLTGSFRAMAPPEPSALLISYQSVLNEAYIHVEAGYPTDWVMIPGYGLQYASAAIPQLAGLMINEAIAIRMISSSDEAYFKRAIMYHVDGTTIVPYWWPCPYCPERFRSPEARDVHIEAQHPEIFNAQGVLISMSPNTRYEDPDTGEQDNIGMTVRWRNTSGYAIRGHVDLWVGYWSANVRRTASSGQNALVPAGGYGNVYFPFEFSEYYSVRAVLYGVFDGVRKVLDEKVEG